MRRQQVDEAVPHVALVLYVAGQIQEVIGVPEQLVDLLRQLLYRVLVRDVPDHYRRPRVVQDLVFPHQVDAPFLEGLQAVAEGIARVVEGFLRKVSRVLPHIHRAGRAFLFRVGD